MLAVVGLLVVLVVAEGGARLLAPDLPQPPRWGDATRDDKVDQMAALAAAEGCVDLVVLGDSMARDGIVPTVFTDADPAQRTAYNAALDAAGPDLVRRWHDGVVAPQLEPATVVVALSSLDLNLASTGLAAADASFTTSLGGRDDALGAVERWLADRSALVEHRRALRDPSAVVDAIDRRLSGETSPPPPPAVVDERGAGTSRRDLVHDGPSPSAELTRTQLLGGFDLGPDPAGRVTELVGALGGDGADVVVLILPTTDDYAALHPRGRTDLDAARAAIVAGAAAAGAPMVDLSDRVVPDHHFADTHHLNGTGADQLSADLPGLLDAAGVEVRHCTA